MYQQRTFVSPYGLWLLEKKLKVWTQLFCFLSSLQWIWNFLIWGHWDFQAIQMKDWIAREHLDCSISSCKSSSPALLALCLTFPRSLECVCDFLWNIHFLLHPCLAVLYKMCIYYISHKQKNKIKNNKNNSPPKAVVRKLLVSVDFKKKNTKKLKCMAVHWTELIRMFAWLIWVPVKLLRHGTEEVDRLEVREGFSNAMFCELQEASREIHL